MLSRLRHLPALCLVVIMLVVTVGCDSASSGRNEPTPTPIPPPPVPERPTYVVRRGEVVDSLSFTGRISPAVEHELYFREDGRVKAVFVDRNSVVQEGTLLGELDNDDLLRQLAQAQIELDGARQNLSLATQSDELAQARSEADLEAKRIQLVKLQESLRAMDLDIEIARLALRRAEAGPSPEDLQIAQSQLEIARNTLWASQIRRDSACGRGGTDCDVAQADVQRNEEQLRIAELTFQRVQRGATQEELVSLRANYERALQRKRQAQLDIQLQQQQIRLAEMAMEQSDAEVDSQLVRAVERAQLTVDRLTAQLDNTQVISPIAGKVTSVGAFEGRTVNAFRPVFVVADETDLEITAEPLTAQMQRLAEGLTASIALSAYPGQELSGVIHQLPYPYGRGGGSAQVDTPDKFTRISFEPGDLAVQPGDLVRVIVVLEQKDDTLWLPPAAIRTFAGRQFVVVQEEGRQRRVDVTIGIESSDRVEIIDGLEEGDVVVGQ
jgi:multidrug efflux pump subunit AcrA (membrane-fusion protein)